MNQDDISVISLHEISLNEESEKTKMQKEIVNAKMIHQDGIVGIHMPPSITPGIPLGPDKQLEPLPHCSMRSFCSSLSLFFKIG